MNPTSADNTRAQTAAREPEFEVLPPEGEVPPVEAQALLKIVAFIMDNLIQIPGTKIRIGLDPILGLVPGFGDSSSAMISALTILQAARQGIPRVVLARMAANILINALGGAIPGIGDLFSLWFKSNQRNYELLLKQEKQANRASTVGDWAFLLGLLSALAVAVILIGVGTAFILYQLFHFLWSF